MRVKPQEHEYTRYFDHGTYGQIQVLATGVYAFVLGQDRLRLKDENVFINLECDFPFDFMF